MIRKSAAKSSQKSGHKKFYENRKKKGYRSK